MLKRCRVAPITMQTTKNLFLALIFLIPDILSGQNIKYNKYVKCADGDSVIYKLSWSKVENDYFPTVHVKVRLNKSKPSFLQFIGGGSETDIYLYNWPDSTKISNLLEQEPIKTLRFYVYRGSNLLEIDDLYPGTYLIWYTSCNFSGSYHLVVEK